jgi:hypothetical protein
MTRNTNKRPVFKTDTSTGRKIAKAEVLAIALPGSRPLKNAKYEKYCRLRALAYSRTEAYRGVGWETSNDDDVYSNACRLERRPEIQDRIAYLIRQEEDLIEEKRLRIEEQLWSMSHANIQDFFEQYDEPILDKSGNPQIDEKGVPQRRVRERPRLLTELPPELVALVEDVNIDGKGRAIPKLYNKLQANKELRAMLNIGRPEERATDLSRLSDAELVAQLKAQAQELGVEIDLNYRFLKHDE